MPDLMDSLGAAMRDLFGTSGRAIVSSAPGVGPEAERENKRVALGGRIGSHIPTGGDARGYGGHGDAVRVLDDVSLDVQRAVEAYVRRGQVRNLRHVRPEGKIRLNKPISLEAHIDDWESVMGAFSLFDGTIAAPGAGNSTQTVSITLPTNTPSPVLLLDRYPGALYMSLWVNSFSFVPTAATGTGLQECWFSDPTGATVGLGVYVASSQTAGARNTIGSLLTGPITDPGNTTLGTLTVNNIGIGGTPTTVRYQLTIGYVAMVPDPWWNEQVIVPPLPAEVQMALESMQAGA